MSDHRPPSCLRRCLTIAGAASVGALLFFAGCQNMSPLVPRANTWPLQQELLFPPPPDDAVLLPDNEILVLAAEPVSGNAMCVFQGGASSPARALGRLPGPGRHAYLCPIPDAAQPLHDHAPRLLPTSAAAAPPVRESAEFRTLLNWSDRLVFDAAQLDGGDVLLFAKGVNRRQDASNVQCIYRGGAHGTVASSPAISSAQQVIRCPPPPAPLNSGSLDIHMTLALNGEEPIPSLAIVPPRPQLSVPRERNLICACTMVRNVAKFLPEWVKYHAAVGIDEFFLYDNASEDDLAGQVARLKSGGINISTVAWPWTKTQEAGLSHCAASHKTSCQWMAFMDVDEFIFSPNWNKHETPSKSLLEEVVDSVNPDVGQIYLPCYDFGPSGQTAHPQEGVCQGYTCRLKQLMRHKSLVRLDAVADSLVNCVHHFELKSAFHFMWTGLARVNHYKFQAWTEFKSKFSRRVSTYVADWKDPVNLHSNDRAPGLGVAPIEPVGWADSFCEMRDTAMKELSERWFGFGFRGRGSKTKFNSNSDIAPSPSFP